MGNAQGLYINASNDQPNESRSSSKQLRNPGSEALLSNPQSAEGGRLLKREVPTDIGASGEWWRDDPADAEDATESGMGRVAHGIPDRVGKLKALGNAQVPAMAKIAWELLTEAHKL